MNDFQVLLIFCLMQSAVAGTFQEFLRNFPEKFYDSIKQTISKIDANAKDAFPSPASLGHIPPPTRHVPPGASISLPAVERRIFSARAIPVNLHQDYGTLPSLPDLTSEERKKKVIIPYLIHPSSHFAYALRTEHSLSITDVRRMFRTNAITALSNKRASASIIVLKTTQHEDPVYSNDEYEYF